MARHYQALRARVSDRLKRTLDIESIANVLLAIAIAAILTGCGGGSSNAMQEDISSVMSESRYDGSTWTLKVIDSETGETVLSINPDLPTYAGSTRKLFSVGMALNQLGAGYRFTTPVYALGPVDASGTLGGDLVLVASGDLTMGARANPDGTIAFSDFDHNEANTLGNSGLVQLDPLAGYDLIASQIAASGIKRVNGDVIIDDRLFEPFDFRNEFKVPPIFVNDDVVDVAITPAPVGSPANVESQLRSSAFTVTPSVLMAPAGAETSIRLSPQAPSCFGHPTCSGIIEGTLADRYVPPFTGAYPLVRTFRITDPASFARTVLIEALARHGVTVDAATVKPNPTAALPPSASYATSNPVARLVSPPFSEYAKFILKVSYNIGADVSLVLYGLSASGAKTMADSLSTEESALSAQFRIDPNSIQFIDGSGGGETLASATAVTRLLAGMQATPDFDAYLNALPVLGVDGSLGFVTDFTRDPALAGAKGKVYAKTGTYVRGDSLLLNGQALAGYIDAKSGRRYVFMMSVEDVPLRGIDDISPVFQDQGRIAAILWKYL